MRRFVLDASVAAKLVLPGEMHRHLADDWAMRHSGRELLLVVPGLFWAEMANLLWAAVRSSRLTAAAAADGLESLMMLGFETIADAELSTKALALALEFAHPAYDMVYAALAQRLETEVVTADERWVRAAGTRLPLRWLGSEEQ